MTIHRDPAYRVRSLLAEQAAEWLVRLEEEGGSQQERERLAAWLRSSPAHVLEFLEAKAVWEAMSGGTLAHFSDIDTLVGEATSAPATVAALNPNQAPPAGADSKPGEPRPAAQSAHGMHRHSGLRRAWNMRLATAAAAVAFVVVGASLWILRGGYGSQTLYETATGEQSTRLLVDGSTVVLNTRSRVRLAFSDQARDVYLDAGEALFEVAHDAARPFRVWAGDSMVRAVGTRFNVYRRDDLVTVTVLEGRVEATSGLTGQGSPVPGTATPERVQLAPGDQARLATQKPIETERLTQPERSIDWHTRRLVFEQTPLAEVIAQFNRYNEVPLQLESPTLAGKRVNVVFDANDRASFVRFLEEFVGVEVEARGDRIVLKDP